MRIERQAFPATEDQLGALLEAVAATAARLGVAPELRVRLELALEELFLNTVHHGLPDATAHVYLTLHSTGHGVRLVYEDEGRAHDPFGAVDRTVLEETAADRRVGGLGILLVEGLAQHSEYRRVGDRNRIELRFEPSLPAN